jgi:hypothetical protein
MTKAKEPIEEITEKAAQPPTLFQPGNQLWKVRSKHGRDKLFTDRAILLEACLEYFEWAESHPIFEAKAYMYQGEIISTAVPHIRALTLAGLCVFIGITQETWGQYRKHAEYSEVISEIEGMMYEQKFSGAAAGMLNANIIARDLGLVEKAEVQSSVTVNIDGKDAEV